MQRSSIEKSCMSIPPPPRASPSRLMFVIGLVVLWLVSSPPMMALPGKQSVRQIFDLPSGPAEVSLKRYSAQTGIDLLFATRVTARVRTNVVKGEITRAEALNLMLADTGLTAVYDEVSGVFTIQPSNPAPMTPNIFKKIKHTFLGLLLTIASAQQVEAQENTNSNSSSVNKTNSDEEIVKMNPFIVEDEDDEGYGFSKSALGTRTVQRVLDIPTSVAAINREFLDDLNAANIASALNYGVSGVTNSTTNSDDVNIRGFRSNHALRDGVMVVNFKRNPLYDIDRVEVIKGPSGLLLGNTLFLGGVINYATKLPTITRQTTVQATASSFDSSFRVEANTSGPIKKSKDFTALYRVTVGGEWGDPKKMVRSIDQTFAGGALTFKYFEDRLRFDMVYYNYIDNGYSYFDDFLDINRSVVGGPAYLNQYSTAEFATAQRGQAYWNQRQDYFNATLTGQLTENSNFRIYYANHKVIDRRALLRSIGVQSDNKTINRQDLPFNVDNNSDMIQLDYLYKTIRSSWRNDFQVGVDAYFETFWQRYALYTPLPIDASNPDYTYNRPTLAGYTASNGRSEKRNGTYWFQDNLTVFDGKLILIGGLRWVDSYSVNENLNTGVASIADSPLVRTHRYGVVYKPTENLSLYYADAANVTAIGGVNGYGDPLKNQEGVLEEFGVKFEANFEDLNVSGSVAYFDMANTQVQYVFTDPNIGAIILQDPTGDTAKGWEAELHLSKKTSNGNLNLVATYSNMSTFRVSTGLRALEAPDQTYSLFGKYSWTSGSLSGLTLGGGLHDQSLKLTGAYTSDFPMTFTIMGRYEINKNWSVQLNGENITDERYVTYVANAALVQAADGANYRLSLKYHW
jgi:iron complex outermembrane recepter protein